MQTFKTVFEENTAELTEKRSKFIATVAHIESAKEASEFISRIKTKFWDAKHNVYAYSIKENSERRFSDDGEPHGTAGKPILDVIVGNGLENVIVVVTRYFGGILLGTGGLVRAYSLSAAKVIESAQIYEMLPCAQLKLECSYSQFDSLKRIIEDFSCVVEDTEYTDDIKLTVCIEKTRLDGFCDRIVDAFAGQINVKLINEVLFPLKK